MTTLDPGETDNTWDAGLIKLASIGDKVWQDTDNDGQQNGGEAGVADAIVTLLNANSINPITVDALGNAISPITTDGTGAYSFTNLDPRIPYVVQFQRPANYVFSKANQGNDTTDSDAVPSASLPTGYWYAPGPTPSLPVKQHHRRCRVGAACRDWQFHLV